VPVPRNRPKASNRGVIAAITAAALVVVLIVAGVGFAVYRLTSNDSPKPTEAEQLLANARRFVKARQTVQWKFDKRVEVTRGAQKTAVESTGSLRSVLAESIDTLETAEGVTTELLVIRNEAWTRAALNGPVEGGAWRPLDIPVGTNLPGLLADMLVRTGSPVVESRSGSDVVLRVQAGSGEYFFFEAGGVFTSRQLLLTMTTDGAIKAIGVRGTGSTTEYRYDTRDLQWDGVVELTPPAESAVDQTPQSDEQLLQSFTDAPILVPAEIYKGWSLQESTVLAPAATEEKCRQAMVTFANPSTGGILDTFSLPATCESIRPPDARDVTINGSPGWIGTKEGDTFAEVIVGGTRFQARSSLKAEQLLPLLQQLVPFDPKNPPPATKIPGRTN